MKVLRMGAALAGGLLITAVAGASLLAVSSASAAGAEQAAPVGAAPGWLTIRAGGLYTCGIRLDHTLWCWGQNDVGQLGLGDTKKRATPSQVGRRTDWAGLAAGFDHTCATRTDHSLWCWGSGRAGQLRRSALDACDTHSAPTKAALRRSSFPPILARRSCCCC